MSPRSCILIPAFLLGCSVEPTIETSVHRDGPRAPAPLERGAGPTPALVAMTKLGEVTVLSPSTGAELGRSAPLSAAAFDLSAGCFPHLGEAWVAVRSRIDEEEAGGDVVAYALEEDGAVSSAKQLAWVEGETSVTATPFGVVIAQEDLGERWTLVPYEGGFTGSIACGRPLSVRALSTAADLARYEALSFWPEGQLSLLSVEVEPTGVTRCDATPLVGPAEVSDGPRLVDFGPGYTRAVADLTDGTLWIGPLDGEAVVSRVAFELGSSRLDSVVRMGRRDGSVELVALGAEPARVAWMEIALASATQLEIVELHVRPLAGEVALAERAPSRSLAVSAPRLFVATTEGLESFVVDREHGLLEAGPVIGSLAGPIAAVTLP